MIFATKFYTTYDFKILEQYKYPPIYRRVVEYILVHPCGRV